MTKQLTFYVGCMLCLGLLLSACNRPVTYYQREHIVHYSPTQSRISTNAGIDETERHTSPQAIPVVVTPATASIGQTNTAIDAYVRNDNKLTTESRVNKRINRLKRLVEESARTKNLSAVVNSHRMTGLERFMLKKLNTKISKHLTPNKPEKPLINGGLLTGSIVLLLGGILLLALTSGTAAAIGVIAAVIGAIGIIFGLIAS